MKNKSILLGFGLAIGLSSFTELMTPYKEIAGFDLKAHLNASGSPAGRTGAPGESPQACATCHSGSTQNGDAVNALRAFNAQGQEVTEYFPDSVYTMRFTITHPSNKKGFQLVGLTTSNNSQAGIVTGISASGTNRVTSGGRQYINHTAASLAFSQWEFTWTAPSSNVGPVRFYAASNATNANNTTSGDAIFLSQHTFGPAATAAVPTVTSVFNGTVLYIPSKHEIELSLDGTAKGDLFVNIIDLQGKSVATQFFGTKNESTYSVGLPNSLNNGTYIVHVFVGNHSFQRKIALQR